MKAMKLVNAEKIKWAVSSFKLYESPELHRNFQVMLQMGSEIIFQILRARLVVGYISKI